MYDSYEYMSFFENNVAVITSAEGRKSMLKLAERMVMSFCAGVGASTAHTWTTLSGSGADDVRVMTRKSMDDPGRPPGIVLSAATSFWLPVSPKRVFDFLRDENSRSEVRYTKSQIAVRDALHIRVRKPNQYNLIKEEIKMWVLCFEIVDVLSQE